MTPISENGISQTSPAMRSGTWKLGELELCRLGYGAMQITGSGVWGPPADQEAAIAVLRRAVELGVNFIDTADSYGPYVSEDLIKKALHPYSQGLIIATKAGLVRTGPGEWHAVGRPEYLRQQCEMSLRRLGLETIDLFQLHRIDPQVSLEDQIGVLSDLQREGKIRHIGLSEVQVDEIEKANSIARIQTVQNRFNLVDRESEPVLDYCEANNIGFIPWFPIATGELAKPGGFLDDLSKELSASPAQLALAWLLGRSAVMLPIPGTSSVEHLEENMHSVDVHLSSEQFENLSIASAKG